MSKWVILGENSVNVGNLCAKIYTPKFELRRNIFFQNVSNLFNSGINMMSSQKGNWLGKFFQITTILVKMVRIKNFWSRNNITMKKYGSGTRKCLVKKFKIDLIQV